MHSGKIDTRQTSPCRSDRTNGVHPSCVRSKVGIFLSFFLFVFETYPFKVGIIRPVLRESSFTLIVMLIYISLSTAHIFNRNGILREKEHDESFQQSDLWDNDTFYALTTIRKLLAIFFYVVVINSAYEFTEPRYFDEEYWVRWEFNRGF